MNPIEQDRLIRKELADFRQRTVPEDTAFPRDVQTLLRSLHEHLFDPGVNVNVLLDRCAIRGDRIYARFEYCLKMSIRQYLEHQRMLAAMELLGRDELDMAPIAFSVGLSAMQMKLLQKIEELTLYLIEQQQQIETLKHQNEALRKQMATLTVEQK